MKPDITLILPIKNEDKILFKNINKYKKKIESITKKKMEAICESNIKNTRVKKYFFAY